MKITVIGTGYVGLVSGTCFAELGHSVTCVDVDADKIARLERGEIPIFESGLDVLVKNNIANNRLSFTTDLTTCVPTSEAVFIAVGTPSDGEEGGADLRYIFAAAEQVAENISNDTIIVTKSTVPVGTSDAIEALVKNIRPDLTFHIAFNPEFLREGCAIDDFMEPDRVVIGTASPTARNAMAELYKPLTNRGVSMLYTDVRSAELMKYASNAFLATKIAFINEMADMCEALNANIEDIANGMGMDKRIGKQYLSPGPGFGGSCFPKDTLALRKMGRDQHHNLDIINAVITSNDARKRNMADKVIRACGGDVKGKTIAILGLAFKANTDDVRYSPALAIIPALVDAGATVKAYDPEGIEQAKRALDGVEVEYCDTLQRATKHADAAVIVTEWDEFKHLNFKDLSEHMNARMLIDLRNLYRRAIVQQEGFEYISIGRGVV